MQQIIQILRGNAHSGLLLLWILGLLGAVLGAFAHLLEWYMIAIDKQKKLIGRGIDTDLGVLALVLLAMYCVFLGLRSVYTVFWAVLFMVYVFEQVVGAHLLRYMPLESTQLLPALYLYLPISALLMLLGSVSTILEKIMNRKP
jgi:hypothetical protein